MTTLNEQFKTVLTVSSFSHNVTIEHELMFDAVNGEIDIKDECNQIDLKMMYAGAEEYYVSSVSVFYSLNTYKHSVREVLEMINVYARCWYNSQHIDVNAIDRLFEECYDRFSVDDTIEIMLVDDESIAMYLDLNDDHKAWFFIDYEHVKREIAMETNCNTNDIAFNYANDLYIAVIN